MAEFLIVLLIMGAGLALLAATANKALVEISWHELEEFCRHHEREAVFDDIHDRFESVVTSTESLQIFGTVVALLAATWLQGGLTPTADDAVGGMGLSLTLIVVATLAILLVTVWLPREIARSWGGAYLVRTWPAWRLADRLLAPLQWPMAFLRIITRRLEGTPADWSEEQALEDEILSIVTEGQHDGLLEDDVREMIAGVIELDDTEVADIMTPRSEMDAISVDMEWAAMLRFLVRVGRTRIPVYDKNLDDVVGLLYVKDLLVELSAEEAQAPPQLREILRDVARVPRSTRLDELLQNFLKTRSHLAIVVDEFLHVVGLVTIEDVLEEIVGEIVDESDQEEPGDIRWIGQSAAEIQGRAHVEEVNTVLGVQLPITSEYDTIGGFILHEFGRIPLPGETLEWQNVKMTIQEATRRRIERVRIDFDRKNKVMTVT